MGKLPQPPDLNIRQWVQLSAVLVFALMILIVCFAIGQHLSDAQFIGSSELKQNVQELESYTAEAQIISDYAQQPGSSLRPYTETYSSSLQKAVDSISEKLSEHAHAATLNAQIGTTMQLADNLSGRLHQQIQTPTRLWPDRADSDEFFDSLTTQLQSLDNSL